MRSYLDILEYAYREESTSTFTHDGVEYNLNCVLSAASDIPSQMTPVSQLVWLLDEAGYYDSNRLNTADLDAPLLLIKWNNRMVVLDGLHRLSKAAQMGVPMIRTVTIPESYLLGCSTILREDEELRSAAHNEISNRPWILSPDPVRWAGKDDDLYVPATPDAAEERIQFYLDLFKTGSAVAYRVMWLTPEHVASLKAGDHLGLCWASKMEDFNSTALSGYDTDVSGKTLYILEAEIPQSSVDWRTTIQQNFDVPWEYEIVVKHGSPLKLRAIRDTGEPYIAYVNSNDGKPIRQDLSGNMFKG